jgi:hypothetical protein
VKNGKYIVLAASQNKDFYSELTMILEENIVKVEKL